MILSLLAIPASFTNFIFESSHLTKFGTTLRKIFVACWVFYMFVYLFIYLFCRGDFFYFALGLQHGRRNTFACLGWIWCFFHPSWMEIKKLFLLELSSWVQVQKGSTYLMHVHMKLLRLVNYTAAMEVLSPSPIWPCASSKQRAS